MLTDAIKGGRASSRAGRGCSDQRVYSRPPVENVIAVQNAAREDARPPLMTPGG